MSTCKQCGTELRGKWQKKFCSQSCFASSLRVAKPVKETPDRTLLRKLVSDGAVLNGAEVGLASDRIYVLKAEKAVGVDVTLIRSRSFEKYAAVVDVWLAEKKAIHA